MNKMPHQLGAIELTHLDIQMGQRDPSPQSVTFLWQLTLICIFLNITLRENELAKIAEGKKHKVRGFPETSRSFIYSHNKGNGNDITWAGV